MEEFKTQSFNLAQCKIEILLSWIIYCKCQDFQNSKVAKLDFRPPLSTFHEKEKKIVKYL